MMPATAPFPHRADAAWRRPVAAGAVSLALWLAGCSTTSGPAGPAGRDGPEARPPPGLADVPDAEPKVEPIRSGPNKPYEVLGKDYTPLREDAPLAERGLASWYGKKFHGRRTASGETYNMYAMTAAHKTMPIPSYARVRNPKNGREIVVRVNDRGPFHAGRVIDLSYTAALKLGVLNGVAPVEVERITFEQIRAGTWRREPAPRDTVPSPEPVVVAAPAAARPEAQAANAAASPSSGTAQPDPALPPAAVSPSAAPLPATVPDTPPTTALTAAAQGFWVQLGAFRQRDGAVQFHQRVATEADWLAPLLAVYSEPALHRLQAGPYPSRVEAQGAADRIRGLLQLVPVVVEKRR